MDSMEHMAGVSARQLGTVRPPQRAQAQVDYDVHRGWVCKCATPWHDVPQLMRDTTDVAMLAAEVDNHNLPPAA